MQASQLLARTKTEPAIGLLVSVRSAEEAHAAMHGGATLIDIKEPARGALGRADDATIASILDVVNARLPVSAALGEWADDIRFYSDSKLSYIKWGLAGCARRSDWRAAMRGQRAQTGGRRLVLTAYADWECAQAPSVEDVFALAVEAPGSVLLIDTHCKAAAGVGKPRPTLLDWMTISTLEDLCNRAKDADLKIALAGSLGINEIRAIQHVRPDWFAVRGAVCADGDRGAMIDADKVRALAELIQTFNRATTFAN
jgi:uncharacterized protein (UPF0264 family)